MGYQKVILILSSSVLGLIRGQPISYSYSNDSENLISSNLRVLQDRPRPLDAVTGARDTNDMYSSEYYSGPIGMYSNEYSGGESNYPIRTNYPYPDIPEFSSVCSLHSVLNLPVNVPVNLPGSITGAASGTGSLSGLGYEPSPEAQAAANNPLTYLGTIPGTIPGEGNWVFPGRHLQSIRGPIPGTIRDAASSPLFSRRPFDPVLVGWIGHYSKSLVTQGIYPDMTLLVSRDGGNRFITPLRAMLPMKGRLITAARYGSTIIVGGQTFPNGNLAAYYSNDDGRTFQKSITSTSGIFYGSCMTNSNEGFLVGILSDNQIEPMPYNPIYRRGVVYYTSDGGITFTKVFESNPLAAKINFRGVSCPRRDNIVVVGNIDDIQAVWTSNDGGRTFSAASKFAKGVLFDVSLSTNGFGAAVGGTVNRDERTPTSAVVVITRDGGRTWSENFRGPGVYYGVQVFSRSLTLVVGVTAQARAAVYRTINTGRSWERYKPSIGWDVLYSVTSGHYMSTIRYHNSTTYTNPSWTNIHQHFSEPDVILIGGNYGTSGDGRSPRLVEMCEYAPLGSYDNYPPASPDTNLASSGISPNNPNYPFGMNGNNPVWYPTRRPRKLREVEDEEDFERDNQYEDEDEVH